MKKLDFIPSVHHEFYKSLKSYVCKNDKNCNCNSLYLVICVFLMITVTIQCLFSYTDPNINKAFRDLAFWGKGTPLKLWVKRVQINIMSMKLDQLSYQWYPLTANHRVSQPTIYKNISHIFVKSQCVSHFIICSQTNDNSRNVGIVMIYEINRSLNIVIWVVLV